MVNWCLTCGLAEKPQCASSGHLSVNMTADIIKSMDSLLNLREELFKLKDIEINNLTKAIEKRKEIKKHLTSTKKSILAASNQVEKLEDENNLLLTEMISLVEANTATRNSSQSQDVKTDLFLQELLSLVENSSPGDTPEILKMKLTKSVEASEQKIREATAIASEYQIHQKAKIAVQMFNETGPIPTCTLLDKGFCLQPVSPSLKATEDRQDLTLISHGIFSLLHRSKEEKINEPTGTNDATSVTWQKVEKKIKPGPKVGKNNEPSGTNDATSNNGRTLPLSINKFTPKTSLFIMRLFKLGTPIGEIHIRPTATFCYPELMQKLGEFCYNSPKDFGYALEKVIQFLVISVHLYQNLYLYQRNRPFLEHMFRLRWPTSNSRP